MFHSRDGWALPLVLLLLTISPFFGTVLFNYSMQELSHTTIEAKRIQAYYLAKSSAEIMAELLLDAGDYTILFNDYEIGIRIAVYEDVNVRTIESSVDVGGVLETLHLVVINGKLIWERF